jgi:hypothetical protein
MGGVMRWSVAVLLALLAGCTGSSDVDTTADSDTDVEADADTDTDTKPQDEPQFSLVGEWTLAHGELLPEDDALYEDFGDWVRTLSADDFPEYTTCMGEVLNADQGFAFESDGNLLRRFDLETEKCPPDGTNTFHTIYVDYGTWSFEANADPLTDGDFYTINGSREWRIYPISSYYRVREEPHFFTLYPAE